MGSREIPAEAGETRLDAATDRGGTGRRPRVLRTGLGRSWRIARRPEPGWPGPCAPALADLDIAEHVRQLVDPVEQRCRYEPGRYRPAPADRAGADLGRIPYLVVTRAEPLVVEAKAAVRDPGNGPHADEIEHSPGLVVWMRDQVLVPDWQAAVGEALLRRDDRRGVVKPVPGERRHVVVLRTGDIRLESVAGQTPRGRLESRPDDIHRMPVQADEPGTWPDPQQQARVLRRPQALVAIPVLPAPGQIGRDHRIEATPQPFGHRLGERAVVRAVRRLSRLDGRRGRSVLDHRPRGGQLPGMPGPDGHRARTARASSPTARRTRRKPGRHPCRPTAPAARSLPPHCRPACFPSPPLPRPRPQPTGLARAVA